MAMVALSASTARAQVAPDQRWLTLETANFRITYAAGLDSLAVRAAEVAEAMHTRFGATLAAPPKGKIDFVITDNTDVSNGFASLFPRNRIVLFAAPPPGGMGGLEYNRGWIELLVTHELAHIFHLDQTGTLGRAVRAVFGRLPYTWPTFPAQLTPRWNIEGLATYIESRETGAGRVAGSFHEMVLRTAALADSLEGIDQASGSGPAWPGGSRAYIYGSMFAEHLAQKYGPEVHKALARRTVDAWIPAFLNFNRIAPPVLGRSFATEWELWQAELRVAAGALRDTLQPTPREMLTTEGFYVMHPRLSPDGAALAFAQQTGRDVPRTVLFDPGSRARSTLSRRNQSGLILGPASWLPDGSALVTSQLELQDPNRIYADLYRIDLDGTETRLTRGARVAEPDVGPLGEIVAVQTNRGMNRLVVLDADSLRPLNDYIPGVLWAHPRWSPDGSRIAAGRWDAGGKLDIAILDAAGRLVTRVTDDAAIDAHPAWSADGSMLYFDSDRTGIPNLYAYDVGAAALYRVSNVLTGAFQPEPDRAGEWLYFVGYRADGFHIERMPLERAAWERVTRPAVQPLPVNGALPSITGETRAYSPWRSLAPTYWEPIYYPETGAGIDVGTFVGFATSGHDLVERHAWALNASVDVEDGLFQGGARYDFRGLGNPIVFVGASRDWEALGSGRAADSSRFDALERADDVFAGVALQHARWRSRASLSIAAELTREEIIARNRPELRFLDPADVLLGFSARAGFANTKRPAFAISAEDGVSISAVARRRWDTSAETLNDTRFDAGYDELYGVASAYRALPLPGFAHHVLAARVAGLRRAGPGASLTSIGGASGNGESTAFGTFGGESLLLPVRGFQRGVRRGTRAWTASAEYRVPLYWIDRGFRLWPFYLDRLSGALFADAGNATCDEPLRSAACGAAGDPTPQPVAAIGAEVGLSLDVFYRITLHARAGVGMPVAGPGSARAYFRLGPSF